MGEETNMNATFSLTFKPTINETFTTIPIKLYVANAAKTATEMETALKALPNYVIDDVKVNSTTADVTSGFDAINFLVYFTGTLSRARRTSSWSTPPSARTAARPSSRASTSSRSAATSRTSRRRLQPITTTTSAAAAASATTTRASATASRATRATSARCRPRSSKRERAAGAEGDGGARIPPPPPSLDKAHVCSEKKK